MRSPWKRLKLAILFIHLLFAAMQGFFFCINIFGSNPDVWILFIEAGFFSFFLYTGISGFIEHRRLDLAWEAFDVDFEQMLRDWTIRLEEHFVENENVNWKRDGF